MRAIIILSSAQLLLAIPAFAQQTIQSTQGACSPTISKVGGSVVVNCNLTKTALKDNAESNLEKSSAELRTLVTATQAQGISNTFFLLPALRQYARDPTTENWDMVRRDVAATQRRLRAAIDSAVDYDSQLFHADKDMPHLCDLLSHKDMMLAQLPATPPTSDFVESWDRRYFDYYNQLLQELTILRTRLDTDTPKSQS